VRQARECHKENGNWANIDAAIVAVEEEAKRLSTMKRLTETIQNNSGKVLEEIRKMTAGLDNQIVALRESVVSLRQG
jgi:hypothetical protein